MTQNTTPTLGGTDFTGGEFFVKNVKSGQVPKLPGPAPVRVATDDDPVQ